MSALEQVDPSGDDRPIVDEADARILPSHAPTLPDIDGINAVELGRREGEPAGGLQLPEGVTEEQWNDEKTRFQNPRIRAFMACNQRLEKVRESNYAILHCSPARASEIISALREVAELIRLAIEPLVQLPSCIPDLENARMSIEGYLATIEKDVLQEIDRLPTQIIHENRLGGVRKSLCVWIGKLHAFLVDCQSELLAADPRSNHGGPDYFPSRRFPKDVEEAEWLHASVCRLGVVVEGLERERDAALVQRATQIVRTGRVLDIHRSESTAKYLTTLRETLLPRLRDIVSLKGIRVSEIEVIDAHASSILQQTAVAIELQNLGEKMVGDADAALVSGRLAEILRSINLHVRDIGAFVAVWERMIAQRRALLMKKQSGATGG